MAVRSYNAAGSGTGPTTNPVSPAQGGTGDTTLTAHAVLVGEGTAPVAQVGPGAANTFLAGTGATTDPVFRAITAADLPAGSVPQGGATAARPATPILYQTYVDTTLGQPIWCTQVSPAIWINAAGVAV